MEWTVETSLKLIDLYRERPILWDPTNNEYKFGKNKLNVWKEIANLMNTDVIEVKKKTESLLASFRRERQRDDSQWFAYQSMRFLIDKYKPRKTTKTETNLEHESFYTEEIMEESTAQSERSHQEAISISQNNKTFNSPRRRLCRKKRIGPVRDDVVLSDALSIMKTMSEKNKCGSSERDECYVFGEYIGKKLKSFDSRTRAILQNDINTLIFKADMNRPPIASQVVGKPNHFMSSFDSHYGKLDQQSLPTFLPRIDSESQTEVSTNQTIKSSPYSSDENSCHSVDHT